MNPAEKNQTPDLRKKLEALLEEYETSIAHLRELKKEVLALYKEEKGKTDDAKTSELRDKILRSK